MLARSGRKPASQIKLAALVSLAFIFQAAAIAYPSDARRAARQSADNFIRSQTIEDPDGSAMRMFYDALMRIDRGEQSAVARVIHYGDSHVAADILTGELRRILKRGFGDAGPGFIFPARPWSWYSRAGAHSEASNGWSIDGLRQDLRARDNYLGIAGVSFTAYEPGERLRMRAVGKRFDLYLMKQPGGAAVDVLLDGEPYHSRVRLSAPSIEPAYLTLEAESDGAHLVELRIVSPGPARIFGVVAENDKAGLVYDAFGLNGARADRPLKWDWRVLEDNLKRRAPDLIIIAYGSNEAGDGELDLQEYEETFSALLARFRRAAPEASVLVTSPPDRAALTRGGWRTISRMAVLVAAQRRAALDQGAAFWDLFQAMGASGSIDRWASRAPPLAQNDRVHLTAQGYRLVAQSLHKEMMRGYVWALVGSNEESGRGNRPQRGD